MLAVINISGVTTMVHCDACIIYNAYSTCVNEYTFKHFTREFWGGGGGVLVRTAKFDTISKSHADPVFCWLVQHRCHGVLLI